MSKSARPIRGDDDEDDDRPRKFKKKKDEGPPMGLIFGGMGVGLVLVAAVVVAALMLRPKPAPPEQRAAAPAPTAPDKPADKLPPKPVFEWKPFPLTGLGAGYTAVFPNGPPDKIDPFEAIKDDNTVGVLQSTGVKMDKWEATADGQTYSVTAFRPPDAASLLGGADALKELGLGGGSADPLETVSKNPGLMTLLLGGGRRVDEKDEVLNGVKYKQVTMRSNAKLAVVRIYGLKDVAIALRAEGPGVAADSERVTHFFLNLTPSRK